MGKSHKQDPETQVPETQDSEAPVSTEKPQVQETPARPSSDDPLAALDAGIAAETPEAPEPEGEPETKDEPVADPEKPEVEAEITTFGLKEKAAARFRELNEENKALREAVSVGGYESPEKLVEDLPNLVQRGKDLDDMVRMVNDTGADAQQFDRALSFLKDANAGVKGDVAAAQRAYAVMEAEMAGLAKLLGKDVGGINDALAGHQDLLTDVDNGELSRERALEIAQARSHSSMQASHSEQRSQAAASEKARNEGAQALDALGTRLANEDAAFEAKRVYLMPMLETIVQSAPPAEWAARAEAAYRRIPAPQAPPTPSKVAPGPMRASGPRPALNRETDDPMEALQFGIDSVS